MSAHIRIAKQVHEILHDKFGAKLSFAAFALGSIFPDIDAKTRNNKHNFSDAVKSLKEILKDAPCCSLSNSFWLGTICHYTTDSFCDAHIKPAKYNILTHFKYEARQTRHIKHEVARAKKLAQLASYPTKSNAIFCYLQKYSDFIKQKRTYMEECDAAVQNSVTMIIRAL